MKPILAVLILAAVIAGCGKNQDVLTPGGSLEPPVNVRAYSAGSDAVGLVWNAPPGASDSLFGGYLVQWTGGKDTLGRATLSRTVSGLPPGAIQFYLFSLLTDGTRSATGAVIQWAPADRFSNLSITEDRGVSSAGPSAIDLGTGGGSPQTESLDNNSDSIDFYLYGGSGQLVDNLQLMAPDQFYQALKATRFSTISDSSVTLDYPRTTFPAGSTFTETSVAANTNTMYYLQLVGPGNGRFYARILITAISGSAPARSVTMQVSLQRAQGVPYAGGFREPRTRYLTLLVPVAG